MSACFLQVHPLCLVYDSVISEDRDLHVRRWSWAGFIAWVIFRCWRWCPGGYQNCKHWFTTSFLQHSRHWFTTSFLQPLEALVYDILPSTHQAMAYDILPSTLQALVYDILPSTLQALVYDILPSTLQALAYDILPSTLQALAYDGVQIVVSFVQTTQISGVCFTTDHVAFDQLKSNQNRLN